ncbi:peptidase [Methylacidiphilum kamchatkense Kam1]|uniref:Peptidase n=1 Tax=Methylacidiphilum kamchatkense Kam1 TaxID=1202785 RepID=A0ABR4ZX52_9BACT|nr:glycosyl hydrolase family 28-related protein [Methylacidiphilum kamchatkense]KIE58812.1 peptidase [Methylacidiphilum kamchatkense Kam1]
MVKKKIYISFIFSICLFLFVESLLGRSTVFWSSEPVDPADGVVLYGGGFDPKEEIFLWAVPDDDPKTNYIPFSFAKEKRVSVSPIQVSDQSIKFQIPAVFPPGIFGVEISENRFLINRPHIEWCQPARLLPGLKQDETYPGSELCIIGKNILLAPEDAQRLKVILVPKKDGQKDGQPIILEVIEAEKYCCRVKIPDNLTPGEFDLLVHNGHGGPAGWSDAYFLKVVPATPWPNKIFNVRDYGAKGNGLADDSQALRKALQAAEANGGGIVYIPAGTYKVRGSFFIPPKTLLEGDGMDFSWLKWPDNAPLEEADFISAAFLTSGQFSLEELSISIRNAKRVLVDSSALKDEEFIGNSRDWEDLSALFKGKVAPLKESSSDVFIRNVRIQFFPFYGYPKENIESSLLWKILKWGLDRVDGLGYSIALGSLSNVEISGCEIIGSRQRAVHLKNGRITQNSFYNPMGAFCITEIGGERLFVEDNWFADESSFYRRLLPLRYLYVAHNQFSEFGRGNKEALSFNLNFPMGKKREAALKSSSLTASLSGNEVTFKENILTKDSLVGQEIVVMGHSSKREFFVRKVIANSEQKITIDRGTSLPVNQEVTIYFLPWDRPLISTVGSSEGIKTTINEKNIFPGLVGMDALIISGKGAGQLRKVTALNANTVSLDKPWDIVPDFSSLLLFYQWEGKAIFFENQSQDCRFLFPLSGLAYDVIFDGNQVKRTQGMIASSGFFIQWLNNVLDVAVSYPVVENKDPLDQEIRSLNFGVLGFLIDPNMTNLSNVPFEMIRGGVLRSNRLAFGHHIIVGLGSEEGEFPAQALLAKDLLIDHNWFEHGPLGVELDKGIRQALLMRNIFFDVTEPLKIKEKKEIIVKD